MMNAEENRFADRARRSGFPRWLIIVIGVLVLVIVAGFVTLKVAFPPEKLRAMVVPRLEERVGREVQLSSVSLRVLPRLAVRLGELAIANPPGFSSEPMLRLDALELQVRLWPLVLRRELELGQVRLVRPVIRYEVLADGTHNFAGLGAAPAEQGEPPGREAASAAEASAAEASAPGEAGAGAAAGLVVADLALRDGSILYSDARNGTAARMSVEARLAADRASEGGRALVSRGRIALGSIQALLPKLGEDSIALPDLVTEYELFADLPGDSAVLRQLSLTFGELPLSGSGSLAGLRGPQNLELALESGDVDIAALLASLPPALRPQDVEASGGAHLWLEVAGSLAQEGGPELNGTLQLQDVAASYGEYGRVLSSGAGQAKFDRAALTVPAFTAQLFGRPFELQLNVTEFEAPLASGRAKGALDLAQFAALREEAMPVEGDLEFDVSFWASAGAPEASRLTGPIALSNISYQSASLAVPARIRSATVQLTGMGISAEAIPIELGGSDLTLSLSSERLLQYALQLALQDTATRRPAGPLPQVRFAVTSRRLEVSELLAEGDTAAVGYSDLLSARLAGRTLEGRDPGELARERYPLPPIPPLSATGRVQIAEFLNPPTQARNIAFDVELQGGVLEVKNLSGEVYGGRVTGTLALDFRQARPPFTLNYDLQLTGGQAGDFLTRWTRLGSALSGLVDFDITGSATIDETLLPAPDGVDAAGRANFKGGRFQEFGLTRALANQFGLDTDFISDFRELGGAYEIKGGQFLVEGWSFSARELDAAISGSAGLGGTLDLELAMEVPPSVLQRAGLLQAAGPLSGLLSQLTQDDTPLQVAVGVGGTMSDPILVLDTEALQEELAKRLEGRGRDLLRRLIKPPR